VLAVLTVGVPLLQKMQKEGESLGEKRIIKFTRVLTILITLAQGIDMFPLNDFAYCACKVSIVTVYVSSLVLLSAGHMFACGWVRINRKGIDGYHANHDRYYLTKISGAADC